MGEIRHVVECYCPGCGAPVRCDVADDAVVRHQTCPCALEPDWLRAIDWAARRKAVTADFFRRLIGEQSQPAREANDRGEH
jgi:hypothetical protein